MLKSSSTSALPADRGIEYRLPYEIGYAGGLFFDLVAKLTGKKFR